MKQQNFKPARLQIFYSQQTSNITIIEREYNRVIKNEINLLLSLTFIDVLILLFKKILRRKN
jgi:hypothetical protein